MEIVEPQTGDWLCYGNVFKVGFLGTSGFRDCMPEVPGNEVMFKINNVTF
jgi:hypothetical protein